MATKARRNRLDRATMASSAPAPFRAFLFLLLAAALLLLSARTADAKITSGKVHLSGAATESLLVKFSVSPSSSVKVDLNLTSYGMYENEQDLRFRIYVDDEWPRVKKEPLCSDKVQLSQAAVPVVFDYKTKKRDDRKGKNNRQMVEMYSARVRYESRNPPNSYRQPKKKDRARYFYFAVDDCSLERSYHDNKIPDMIYDMSVMNGRPSSRGDGEFVYEHLPADEDGITLLLVLTIFGSGALALLLFYKLAQTIGGEVHVAILVVIVACLTNALSAFCELAHMKAFNVNGYGIYSLDALSGHFEAVSDSMVTLILLSIGGGWTLPSDVVGGGMGNEGSGNKLLKGVRNPAGSLLALGGSGDKKGGMVAITIILVHVGLAQWGRTFDDDFDTYHALEHPPGRFLMIIRFVFGLVFVTGVGMIRSGGRCPPSLMSFLTKFALVGLSYFASLPGISAFVGSALPYHQRHQALHWGAAAVQGCCLASLTWLFAGGADASAYHRLSRAGKNTNGGDLTESIASGPATGGAGKGTKGPSMWHIGKTKIRLD